MMPPRKKTSRRKPRIGRPPIPVDPRVTHIEIRTEMTAAELTVRRERLELTVMQLARLLGVPHSTVMRWERGAIRIVSPQILHLALCWLEHTIKDET